MENLPTTIEPLGWYEMRALHPRTDAVLLAQSTTGSRVPDALREMRRRFRGCILDVRATH